MLRFFVCPCFIKKKENFFAREINQVHSKAHDEMNMFKTLSFNSAISKEESCNLFL